MSVIAQLCDAVILWLSSPVLINYFSHFKWSICVYDEYGKFIFTNSDWDTLTVVMMFIYLLRFNSV